MPTNQIAKYRKPNILISNSLEGLQDDVKSLFQSIDKYDKELAVITKDLAAVDKSIAEFQNEVNASIEAVAILGQMVSKSPYLKAGFDIVSLIGKTYCGIAADKKRKEASVKAQAREDAVLSSKKIQAQEKLPHIKEVHDSFKESCLPQIVNLYNLYLHKEVLINDSDLNRKVKRFVSLFELVIKSRFINDTFEYYEAEMTAWIKGYHSSKEKRPSYDKEIEIELKSWAAKLFQEGENLDDKIRSLLQANEGSCPLPIAATLSNPCLLRNYVGINIGEANNCSAALIKLSPKRTNVKNPIILSNPYYQFCESILSDSYSPPKKVIGFSILDALVLLVIPALLFGMSLLLFRLESSTFWRIFFLMPVVCWVSLGIEFLDNNFYNIFPYIHRLEKYNSRYKSFRDSVIKQENRKEFHILD